jgi:fatty acid amide hydrolase
MDGETACHIASQVTLGAARASDLLARHCDRHRQWHRAINALVQPREEAAADARAVDARIASGGSAGPLAGVPMSVKECFAVRGLRTTLGIPSRREVVDVADADIVAHLKRAGAVVVGKANVPQAMFVHETDNPVWGRTCHPMRSDRSPGGSSGGDAALVAAGVVPLALGNDLAGSLRQPAHACGIAALVPRSVAVGTGGAFDTMPHLEVIRSRAGFLATRTADLRLALRATSRATPNAFPRTIPRVGWWDDAGPVPASPAVGRAVREAVDRLRAGGCDLVPLDPEPATEAAWLHLALLAADGGRDVRDLFGGSRPMPPVRRLLRLARLPRVVRPALALAARLAGRRLEAEALASTGPLDRTGFARLLARREALAGRIAELLADCDAVICPVAAVPAMPHGSAARLVLAAAPCLLANLLDLAAGTVPMTQVAADEQRGRVPSRDPVLREAAACDAGSRGLPIGVQVIAAPDRDEATVLDLMERLEASAA